MVGPPSGAPCKSTLPENVIGITFTESLPHDVDAALIICGLVVCGLAGRRLREYRGCNSCALTLRLLIACVGMRHCTGWLTNAGATPDSVLYAACGKYVNKSFPGSDFFWLYEYGSALLLSTAYDVVASLHQPSWTAPLDDRLLFFRTNSSQRAYKILHNITLPVDYAVGDYNIYPIAYLSRLDYYGLNKSSSPEWTVAILTAELYLERWPYLLNDGTFSRKDAWPGQPSNGTVLWGDDATMGLTLLARLAAHGAPSASAYIDQVAAMALSFAAHLRDPATGVFYHAYNEYDDAWSCCLWGVSNGYILEAYIEVLTAMAAVAPGHPQLAAVVATFRAHAMAMVALQAPDGRWHTLLNDTSTYLETSVTSMCLFSLARGVLGGWLDRATFDAPIQLAWSGLASQVHVDGTVDGICEGTGIQPNASAYQARGTPYSKSSPGLGSVFMAALAVKDYVAAFSVGSR